MSQQETLFDGDLEQAFSEHPASVARRKRLDEAQEARDRALYLVERHADPDWLADALEAVYRTAERLPYFHVDEVWETGLQGTVEDRAMGPVMRRAARMGWISKTDRVAASSRSHGSGKPIWRSHLFMGELS